MAPGRKPGNSCWTCRLRRKRCDSVLPVCGNCQTLQISCHYDKARPLWMDGGTKQKQMAETLKQQVKQNAFIRREQNYLDPGAQTSIENTPPTNSGSQEISHYSCYPADKHLSAAFTSSNAATTSIISNTVTRSVDQPESVQSSSVASSTLGVATPIPLELGSIMTYLDYVFPFLFPFYQPSLQQTGRQWLLGLLCQNEVSFHIAASLSAYFFSLVPQKDGQKMHEDCKALVLDQLNQQMDMAIKSMQNTITSIDHTVRLTSLLDRIRIMEEIIQLLIVELMVQRKIDWTMHLSPALIIFDEIFKAYGIDRSEPSLSVLLSAIPSSLPVTTVHHKTLPYTADQSALLYFISLLLFIDIIASTSLGTPPTLQEYHHNLLDAHSKAEYRIQLESVIGCHNWVLIAIGNISTLCAWKREARANGTFSVVKLVSLATTISQTLDEGLQSLASSTMQHSLDRSRIGRLESYYGQQGSVIDRTCVANVTKIWAHAAKIYLFVTLSGWQTKSIEIQSSVAEVVSLLRAVKSPGQLRSLSWPMSVAGCLASPDQEDDFRRVAGSLGQLGELGTVYEALTIMEAVWSRRDTIDGDGWTIASSLNILGSPTLLL